jgi:hypothetical protein
LEKDKTFDLYHALKLLALFPAPNYQIHQNNTRND